MIDTLTKKARNWLKKTGDAMIAGDLTLFRDPTLPLHAATKQYSDAAGNSFDYRQQPIAGAHYYFGSWGGTVSGFSLLSGDIGTCFVAPMKVSTALTWTGIRGSVGNASNSTHRVGIYYLSETTWLPTSIAVDAGTFTWPGAGQDHEFVINFTATSRLIGLAWFYESRTDGVNPFVPFKQLTASSDWPPGWDALNPSLLNASPFRIISTGNAAGALPAVGTFSHSSAGAGTSNAQPGLALRRA